MAMKQTITLHQDVDDCSIYSVTISEENGAQRLRIGIANSITVEEWRLLQNDVELLLEMTEH